MARAAVGATTRPMCTVCTLSAARARRTRVCGLCTTGHAGAHAGRGPGRRASRSGRRRARCGLRGGLIAFGALARGPGTVMFNNDSTDSLEELRTVPADLGVIHRCRFVPASADDPSPIADACADVVTTRSVLIFVDDKRRSLHKYYQVLRPGGRASVLVPINRLHRFLRSFETQAVRDLQERVAAESQRFQPPELDPVFNVDHRHLAAFAEGASFAEVRLTLTIEASPPRPPRVGDYDSNVWNEASVLEVAQLLDNAGARRRPGELGEQDAERTMG
ncbi:MAG: methyltransferase domain-containing protein [Chloroflexi bacterium]|nr:methyltransferase domain-containing protein [Chloroflexota bacterium]